MTIIKHAQSSFELNEIYDQSKIGNDTKLLLLNPEATKVDAKIKERFIKYAQKLKRIAPKASDFLYFSTVMLHSAEAALVDQDSGQIKKDAQGNDVTAEWIVDTKTGSWKWKCSDTNIKPYRNNNSDCFPEPELKKAYRKWIGRPLCKDHMSSSVDGVRGLVLDVYYDDVRKRVIGLCALDKVNYPDLARKISRGYITDTSMGVAVSKAVCSECGRVASTENEYCDHMRNKNAYAEINIGLSPIELSLVVTGADPRAKLRSVIASVNKYSDEKKARIEELQRAGCVTPAELQRLWSEVDGLRKTVADITKSPLMKEAEDLDVQIRNWTEALENTEDPNIRKLIEDKIVELMSSKPQTIEPPYGLAGNKAMTGGKGQSSTQDLESAGPPSINDPTGFDTRFASDKIINQIEKISLKLNTMEQSLHKLACDHGTSNEEERKMSDKLSERAAARRAMFQKSAYFQGGGGVNDPQTYPKDEMGDRVRNNEDKQMVGMNLDENPENLGGGKAEEDLKKKLSRAELKERKMRRHALLKGAELQAFKTEDGKVVTYDKSTGQSNVSNAEDFEKLQMDEVFADDMDKKAYFQGGGGVNDPQTYPKDEMGDKVRNNEDKQMVGMNLDENPENLGGGAAELAEKKRLLRADQKLRAKFVLAFKNEDKTIIDKENSRWEVYAGPKKVLAANGSEIYEDELEGRWETLASKNYGRKLLAAIREEGLEKVAYLLKGDGVVKIAEPMPPVPAPMPEAPMPEVGEPMNVDGEPEPEMKEDAGDPIDSALTSLTENLEEAEKSLGDLKDALQEQTGETEAELPSPAEADDEEEEEEEEECEEEEEEEMEANDAQEIFASLDESNDELAMLAESVESRVKAGRGKDDVVMAELLRLSQAAIEENKELRKQASLIVSAKKKEEKEEEKEDKKKGKKDKKEKKEKKEEKEDKKKSKAELLLENLLKARATKRREIVRNAEETLGDVMEDLEKEEFDDKDAQIAELKAKIEELEGIESEELEELEEPELDEDMGFEVEEELEEDVEMDLDDELAQMLDDFEGEEELEAELAVDDFDLEATARKEWRNQIAKEAAEYQLKLAAETDMPLGETHNLEGLDTKTPEAAVEGIVEIHEKIMKEVQNLPKVREAMDHIGGLLKAGKLSVNDLENKEKLTALAVDADAAKYWKDYFNQGDSETKAFGNELTKEYSSKKAEAGLEEQKIRMKRAYDLALDMQEKGLISDGVSSLHSQVDGLMGLSNASFESLKKVVANTKKPSNIKTAAPAMQVGMNNEEQENVNPETLIDQLKKMW